MTGQATDRVGEIRARLEALGQVKWELRRDEAEIAYVADRSATRYRHEAKAAFIANAPADIEFLLGEVERLRGLAAAAADLAGARRERAERLRAALVELQSEYLGRAGDLHRYDQGIHDFPCRGCQANLLALRALEARDGD